MRWLAAVAMALLFLNGGCVPAAGPAQAKDSPQPKAATQAKDQDQEKAVEIKPAFFKALARIEALQKELGKK